MCRLALLADVDDAEEGAAWIGEDHEVSILGVLPLDTAGAQGDEAFHLRQLLLFGVNPEVEVCPVILIEMDARSLFPSRKQECGVVLLLAVLEGTCPEGTGVPDVLDIDDKCSNAQHTFQFAPRK